MNINIQNIISVFKKVKGEKHGTVDISRDWKILMAIFFIINAASFVFAVHSFFVNERQAIIIKPEEAENIETFNRDALQSVLAEYKKKKDKFDMLISSGAQSTDIVDPSR